MMNRLYVIHLIVGTDRPTKQQLERIRFVVAQSWWRHGHVVTTDGHGINAEVARQCQLQGVPCTIVGTGARAANGATGIYMRVVVEKGIARTEKKAQRDAFALSLVDRVITLGVEVKTEKWKCGVLSPHTLTHAHVHADEPPIATALQVDRG